MTIPGLAEYDIADIPAELVDEANEWREKLLDSAASFDDDLMEKTLQKLYPWENMFNDDEDLLLLDYLIHNRHINDTTSTEMGSRLLSVHLRDLIARVTHDPGLSSPGVSVTSMGQM